MRTWYATHSTASKTTAHTARKVVVHHLGIDDDRLDELGAG